MPTLTSERLNYLVWRYLQEEGLSLAAYALDRETSSSSYDDSLRSEVGRGALVDAVLQSMVVNELGTRGPQPYVALDTLQKSDTVLAGGRGSGVIGSALAIASDDVQVYKLPETTPAASASTSTSESKLIIPLATEPSAVLAAQDQPTTLDSSDPLVVGYASGAVRLWGLGPEPVLQAVLMPEAELSPALLVVTSPDVRLTAAVLASGDVYVWDLAERRIAASHSSESGLTQFESNSNEDGSENTQKPEMAEIRLGRVSDAVWVHDKVLAISHAKGLLLIDTERSNRTELVGDASAIVVGIAALRFSPVLKLLAAGTETGDVLLWSESELVGRAAAALVPAPVVALAWLGIWLLCGSADGSLRLFDVRNSSPTVVAELKLDAPVLGIAVDSEEQHIAVHATSGIRIHTLIPGEKPDLRLVGHVDLWGVQAMTWLEGGALALTTQEETTFHTIKQ